MADARPDPAVPGAPGGGCEAARSLARETRFAQAAGVVSVDAVIERRATDVVLHVRRVIRLVVSRGAIALGFVERDHRRIAPEHRVLERIVEAVRIDVAWRRAGHA